jgi:hypothetical protein
VALTSLGTNNELIKFQKEVRTDFLRASRFDPYMGDGSDTPIARIADLSADGKQINVPLVTQMTGNGAGTGLLRGNEEQLANYGMPLWADWARNAINFNKQVEKNSSFNIESAVKTQLRNWGKRIVRDALVDGLLAIPTATIPGSYGSNAFVNGVVFSGATATQKNNWVTANSDRVVFGSQLSNYSTTFATAVANVDSTNDKLTADVVRLMKSVALGTGKSGSTYTGKPIISPWMIPELDQEMFVLFVGRRTMRDLRKDSTMLQANRDARARENGTAMKNPIFTGGELIWEGVIIKEIPEITDRLVLAGVGAASIDVEPIFLCGANALAYVTGQLARPTTLEDADYQFITGLGIEAQFGTGKLAMSVPAAGGTGLVDFGMVTGFMSGVADA